MSNPEINERIDYGEFTIYDKFLYGGLGYGHICLPRNLIRVILSLVFPPFGIILKHLQLQDEAPYITKGGLINLFNNLGDVIFSVFLTFCFWVPGVIYSFQQLKVFGSEIAEDEERFTDKYGISPNELTDDMVKEFMSDVRKKKKYNL